jgi:hypothetical protein
MVMIGHYIFTNKAIIWVMLQALVNYHFWMRFMSLNNNHCQSYLHLLLR